MPETQVVKVDPQENHATAVQMGVDTLRAGGLVVFP